MDDYISRQAAIEVICDTQCSCKPKDCHLVSRLGPGKECSLYYYVQKIPPANVRPMVRGRWVLDSDPGEPWRYVCDQCGEVTKDTCMGEPRAAFCQMCGADMRPKNNKEDNKS